MSKNDASPIPKVRTRTAPKLPAEYAVGYKNPPKDTQFKKGQSGNPKGRKKASKNSASILQKVLSESLPVRENGETRRRSKREVVLTQLANKAASGDLRAIKQLTDLELRLFAPDTEEATNAPTEGANQTVPNISQRDQEILRAYEKEILKEASENK